MKYAAIADWATDKQYPVTFSPRAPNSAWPARATTDGSPAGRASARSAAWTPSFTATIQQIHAELTVTPVCGGSGRSWSCAACVSPASESAATQAAGLQGRHPRAWKKTTVAGLRPIDAPY